MRWQFMIAAFLVILGSGAAIPEDAWVWGTDTELKSPTFEEPSSSASSITLSALSTSTSPSTAVGTAQNDEEEEEPYESAESRSISDDPDIDISRSSDELLDGPTNDTEPRFIGSLKKKMCSVGLGLNCGHKGYKPAVQHYGKPADIHEVQYVQPVEIRPVGKPIPAVPKNHYGTHRDSSYATVPNTHGSASHGGSGGSYGSGHGGGGGGGYAAAASPSHYGESSSGGYAPAQAPSHYESPEPLSNLYGAPSNIAPSYGPPKASSIYSAPPPPSSSYNAPQNPGSSYNAPQGPAASYNAPQAPAASYNAPQAPAASYGAPQISGVGGGNGQTVKHIHIHQHVYKVDNSGGSGGQGGFGGGPSGGYRGGFDSNVISGSDHSFLSTPLSVGREAVDIKPSIKTIEKKEAFKAGKLSSPLNSVVGAPAGEYTIDNDGVTEPLRLAGSRELGCTCVRQEQCPPELVASSPFGREDLFGLQDPRNSPSSILSNETEALLPARFRREVKPPVDQLAIPSITQAQQSRELFPTEIHFDDSLYDDIISSDTMLETVGTGITIGDLLTPSAPSVNIVDTGRAKESLIEDVTNHIPQVIPSNRQYILACKNSGLQKEVRVRRDTKDSKEVKDSKEIRDSQTTTTNSDPATVSATDRELKHFFEENEEKPSPRIFGHVANLLKALPLGLTFKISNVPHLEHLLPPTPLLGPTPLGIGSPGLPFLKKKLDSATDPSELSLDTHSSVDSLIRPSDRFPLLPQAEPHSYNSLTHSYDRFFPTKPSSHSSLPPLSPLTHSPSIIPSVFRPPRLFRPQTLVDKKVGAAASVHDTSPFRHPVPGLHGIGLNSFNIYGPGDPLFSQHGSQNAMCLQVSCRSLEYYCQRQLSSLVPSQCGLYEVCCNLDGFQGAFSSSFNSFTSTRACGIKNNDGVNGRVSYPVHKRGDAEFGEYPWQAAVLKKEGIDNVYICAGTMIDQSHILTAAHCIKGYAASQLRVRLGEYDVNQDTEFFPYFEADVNGVFVNPDFYSGNLINDIAVIRMASPVDFLRNPHISPICLPARGQDFTGQRCWVSGWGKDGFGDNGQYQSILKEVDLTVIPPLQCQQLLRRTRLGSSYQLHPGMICAGGEQGKDACKGDGGGPMACALPDGHYALAGIVSWGIGCGTPGIPGVYVNVAYYLDWISTIVNF